MVTLPLRPEILVAAYEYLRACPPFNRWKLPHADEVEFVVGRVRTHLGSHCKPENHRIMVSAERVGHTLTLMAVLAHEMVHLHQAEHKTETPNSEHNAEFRKLAKRVCAVHGFDPREF